MSTPASVQPSTATESILPFILMVVLSVRVAMEAVVICSLRTWADQKEPAFSILLTIWRQWDAQHYLEIAEHGYTATGETAVNIVFLPLFPWAIRLLAFVFKDYLLAGIMVSLLSSVLASYFLYHLVRQDLPEAAARNSILFLNVFPTAYCLIAPYTEPLFLALTFASLYFARVGRIRHAAILGALSTATKVNGLLLWPTLLLLCLNRSSGRFWSPRLLWLLAVPFGFLCYLGINYCLFGNPLHFLEVQREHWFHGFRWPWQGLEEIAKGPFSLGPSHERMVIYDLGGVLLLLAIIASVWSLARLPFAYGFQGIATLIMLLSTSWNISLGRYVYSVVPLFFFLGSIADRPAVRTILLLFFLPFLGFLTASFATARWAY